MPFFSNLTISINTINTISARRTISRTQNRRRKSSSLLRDCRRQVNLIHRFLNPNLIDFDELFVSGIESDFQEQERSDGDGGGEQSSGGDQSPADEPEIRREDGRGIEAERIQRIQRSSVRHEERELSADHDPPPRRGVLVVAGGGGDPIAVDDDGREVGVNGGDGEASAESGGGGGVGGGRTGMVMYEFR